MGNGAFDDGGFDNSSFFVSGPQFPQTLGYQLVFSSLTLLLILPLLLCL